MVTTTCSGLMFIGVSYEVRLDGGQVGNILGREMRQGATRHEHGYQVHFDAGHTTVRGNGVRGIVYPGTMLLSLFTCIQNRTVYGGLPASQPVDSGDHADSPVITVIYQPFTIHAAWTLATFLWSKAAISRIAAGPGWPAKRRCA